MKKKLEFKGGVKLKDDAKFKSGANKKLIQPKKFKGITLLTLVITIVIMIIIAGVSISVIVDDGIFDNASKVTKEHQKESLVEVVRTAVSYLEVYNIHDYNKAIDIESLKNKIFDISDINENDYIIEESENMLSIINKKTGAGVEVLIDSLGEVIISGIVVGDISEISKTVVKYTLSPDKFTYQEEVTVTIVVEELTSGLARTKFEGQEENRYTDKTSVTETYTITKAGKYIYEAESNNGRITIVEIDVPNAVTIADSSTKIGVSYDITAPTNRNVKVTFTNNSGDSNLVLKYQIGSTEGTWIKYTGPVEMQGNGVVYARLFNKDNQYKGFATATVANIDKVAPVEFELRATATTYSITVSGSTTDVDTSNDIPDSIEGIRGYQYILMDEDGEVIYESPITTETSYTFDLDVLNASSGDT